MVSYLSRPLKRSLRYWIFGILLLLSSTGQAHAQGTPDRLLAQSQDAYVLYNDLTQTFEIGTAEISRQMDYEPDGTYQLISLKNKRTGREWLAAEGGATAELRLGLDGQIITGAAHGFSIRSYSVVVRADSSLELEVLLMRGALMAHLHYTVYPGTSVLEQWAEVENYNPIEQRDLTALDSISFAVSPSPEPLTLYWVQGLNPPDRDISRPQKNPTLRLSSVTLLEGMAETLSSSGRSSEGSMGWFALAAPSLREGLFGGLEWSGAWMLDVKRSQGQTLVHAGLQGVDRILAPGEIFVAPRRFLGFYTGTLDNAANESHEFVRRYLMRPRPAAFPWTQYNTWFAYYTDLDEKRLRAEVDHAAQLGLEAFYIDAGWYEGSPVDADFSFGLGTWRENKAKFPSGLAAFSDYVHGKGMKFGLWVEPERVDLRYVGPDEEISEEWLAPGTPFGVEPPPDLPQYAQVCLGHPAARQWMKDWLTRIVRDYRVDWLKWDNNFWASCDPPGRAGFGNYAHVLGLYEVLDYLRQEFPDLIVENCASGGNRMDYGLIRRTDIAWLSDETDPSYRVRYHVFGASYPFPPEYLNSWLVESYFEHLVDAEEDPALLRAWLRSRMMGAFGISISTLGWNSALLSVVAVELERYKRVRPVLVNGLIYHLLPQSDLELPQLEPPTEPDATEFYDPVTDRAVVFLFRGRVDWNRRQVRLRGLPADHVYKVNSADGAISIERTGSQLMRQNINLPYAQDHPSTLLFVTPK